MRRVLALILMAGLLLTGCNGAPRGSAYAPLEENRLTIYTSHKADVYAPIIQEFEARTGIWVQIESGGTNEMLERIAAEGESPQIEAPQADLMFGGGVESLEVYNDYFLHSAIDTSIIYQEYLNQGSKWIPFSSLPQVLIYNPKLVTLPPTGWASLLDPKWQGRIAFADPAVSGSSYTALATMLQALPMEQDELMLSFAQNLAGNILSGSGEVVGAVANGTCLVGVTLEETALKGIALGADIAMVYPSEGTSAVPDGVAILSGCAHLDNAEAFIAFILSADVQHRLASNHFRRSVLAGLFVSEDTWPLTLSNYDIGWASQQKGQLLNNWQACIGEGGI